MPLEEFYQQLQAVSQGVQDLVLVAKDMLQQAHAIVV